MIVSVIVYHKDILNIYKREWIDKCIMSIYSQTFKDFKIYELNYGEGDLRLFDNSNYYKINMLNHADAMNFLIQKCLDGGSDCVFNVNIDDWFEPNRFEIQLSKILEGYDVVSSNFRQVDSNGNFLRDMLFSYQNILDEFNKDSNIIAHPSVCFSRNFLLMNRYNTDEIPEEDFKLWKRTIGDYKFFICDEILLNYRIHNNQITYSDDVNISSHNILYEGNINKPNLCICGELKNRVKYNFCQKCNKLY